MLCLTVKNSGSSRWGRRDVVGFVSLLLGFLSMVFAILSEKAIDERPGLLEGADGEPPRPRKGQRLLRRVARALLISCVLTALVYFFDLSLQSNQPRPTSSDTPATSDARPSGSGGGAEALGPALEPSPVDGTFTIAGGTTSRPGYAIAPAGCEGDVVHASSHLRGRASSLTLDLVIDDLTPAGRTLTVEIITDGSATTKYLSVGDGTVRVADLDLTDVQELDIVITAGERPRADCTTSPTRLVVDGTLLLAQ